MINDFVGLGDICLIFSFTLTLFKSVNLNISNFSVGHIPLQGFEITIYDMFGRIQKLQIQIYE